MGSLGFLFAPLAMGIAKGTEKVLAALLDAVGHPAVLSLASISAIKAVEYGLLGWLLGRLAEKQVGRPALYLLAGATVGLVFGGTLTALNYHVAMAKGEPLVIPKILGMGINEVLFPIGCGLVIYIGQVITRHLPNINPK